MRKYGLENFSIEILEETNKPEEREIFWIEQKNSYRNGYNATLGGDGKKYTDYELIVNTYKEIQNLRQTAETLGVDVGTVRAALNSQHIPIIPSAKVTQKIAGKKINQYDLQGNFIKSFPSATAAAKSLNKITSTSRGAATHIMDVCKGKRKTAYGYIWNFAS